MLRLALAIVLSTVGLTAQESQLKNLQATLLALRKHAEEHRETRGATVELTLAKHQLRDWIESRLTKFPSNGDFLSLSTELHAGLRDSQLFCDDDADCFPSSLGFLDEIMVRRERNFLIIETAVGIWCGYDYSAYLYRWTGGRWHRQSENEQDDYGQKKYAPQIIHAVHVSAPAASGDSFVLTLGSRPGCASAFQPVYYRVWRLPAAGKPAKLLLDGSEMASVDGDPPVSGLIGAGEALIEFKKGGVGYGSSHRAVRHFRMRGERMEQTDPIAVTPRDFVEEWLNLEWRRSAGLSESVGLKSWHTRLHREDGMGDFPDPAVRCSNDPALWQISTHLHEMPKVYYLVRWQNPFHFTMTDIRNNADPNCTQPDPKGDEELPLSLTRSGSGTGSATDSNDSK